jgi:hypothetical protein
VGRTVLTLLLVPTLWRRQRARPFSSPLVVLRKRPNLIGKFVVSYSQDGALQHSRGFKIVLALHAAFTIARPAQKEYGIARQLRFT